MFYYLLFHYTLRQYYKIISMRYFLELFLIYFRYESGFFYYLSQKLILILSILSDCIFKVVKSYIISQKKAIIGLLYITIIILIDLALLSLFTTFVDSINLNLLILFVKNS